MLFVDTIRQIYLSRGCRFSFKMLDVRMLMNDGISFGWLHWLCCVLFPSRGVFDGG